MKFLISKFNEDLKHTFLSSLDFSISGMFVVDLPDGVQIDTPSDYTDLKTKKSNGFVSLFPDFSNVHYNELDNDSSVNPIASGHRADTGNYEWLLKAIDTDPGMITTNVSVLGGTPSQYIVFWSVYEISWGVGKANALEASYIEHDASEIQVEVSLDNGANWDIVTYQEPIVPTVPDTDLIFRFSNSSATDLYLGYYSLIWRS